MGRWDDALARGAEVRAHPEFARSPQLVAECALLMHVHVNRGELDEARELLRVIEEQAAGADRRLPERPRRSRAPRSPERTAGSRKPSELATNGFELGERDRQSRCRRHGLLRARAVEAAFALEDLDDGRRVARPRGRAQARRTLGRTSIRRSLGSTRDLPRSGRTASAEARFKLAAASFRERDVRFYLAATLLEYGEWLARPGTHRRRRTGAARGRRDLRAAAGRTVDRAAREGAGERVVPAGDLTLRVRPIDADSLDR